MDNTAKYQQLQMLTNEQSDAIKEFVETELNQFTTNSDNEHTISKKPEYFIMPNSKLSNELQNAVKSGDVLVCNVNPSGIKNKSVDASVFASLRFDSDEITLPKSYSAYDREVFNTVCSLFEAGNVFIWPEQVYRTMTGKTNTEFISPQSVEMVTKSMRKQMSTIITIDATKQFQQWKIPITTKTKDNKVLFYGNMLYLVGFDASINGQLIHGWKRVTEQDPILLQYNKAIGQIVTVPLKLLDTTSVTRNTKDIIIMKNYMIREIERMKHPNNNRNNILLYDTMFTACQIKVEDKGKKKRLRDIVKKILDYWISLNYIGGYEENTKGRTCVSLTIDISDSSVNTTPN